MELRGAFLYHIDTPKRLFSLLTRGGDIRMGGGGVVGRVDCRNWAQIIIYCHNKLMAHQSSNLSSSHGDRRSKTGRQTVDANLLVARCSRNPSFSASLHGLTGSADGHRSTASGFKPWPGYVERVFHLSLRLVVFRGFSHHLACIVHKGGRKTATCTFL